VGQQIGITIALIGGKGWEMADDWALSPRVQLY